MYRALAATMHLQGYAGLYDGYLPWPFAEREKAYLREAPFPEAQAQATKRCVVHRLLY